jgi:transcription elongation factor GreA
VIPLHNELTKNDLRIMREELEHIRLEVMPGVIEEVKRTRAFGDLSENDEYKTAKREQNKYRSRMRYLEGMIKTARVIDDRSGENEVGLFDKVEIYIPEDDETQVIQVVSTVRTDPRKGLISMDSPFGKSVLGKKVGDVITVHVNDNYSYEAEIKSITKGKDDGSVPLLGY